MRPPLNLTFFSTNPLQCPRTITCINPSSQSKLLLCYTIFSISLLLTLNINHLMSFIHIYIPLNFISHLPPVLPASSTTLLPSHDLVCCLLFTNSQFEFHNAKNEDAYGSVATCAGPQREHCGISSIQVQGQGPRISEIEVTLQRRLSHLHKRKELFAARPNLARTLRKAFTQMFIGSARFGMDPSDTSDRQNGLQSQFKEELIEVMGRSTTV